MRFLAGEANFDLNKCFNNGIPFMSIEKEEEYKKMLNTKYSDKSELNFRKVEPKENDIYYEIKDKVLLNYK